MIDMTKLRRSTVPWVLVIGDGVSFVLVTLLGFARHEALQVGAWERILATFIPFYFAWLVTAPWLGLFNPAIVQNVRQIWRVPIATIYAAPMVVCFGACGLDRLCYPFLSLSWQVFPLV